MRYRRGCRGLKLSKLKKGAKLLNRKSICSRMKAKYRLLIILLIRIKQVIYYKNSKTKIMDLNKRTKIMKI